MHTHQYTNPVFDDFARMSLNPRPRYTGAAGLTAQNSYDTLHEQFNRNMHLGGFKSKSSHRRRSRSKARFSRRKRTNRK